MPRWNPSPIRLSPHARPPGGQGQPYGDAVVAEARLLVETTQLTQKEIGRQLGISHMTVGRWRRAGGWRRPPGSPKAPDERSRKREAMLNHDHRVMPWRKLEQDEFRLNR